MPLNIEALLDAAVSALQSGEITTCETNTTEVLNELKAGDRRIPEALSLRGTVRMRYDSSAGLTDLREAVRLDPNEPQFQMTLGQALFATGQAGEAENFLGRAFQMSRGHPAAASIYGRCLIQVGKAFQAVQVLGPLVERGNAPSGIIKLLAEAQFHSGDIFSSRDVLSQLYGDEGPVTAEERLQLLRIDLSLRDFPTARQNLDALLKDNPESVDGRISGIRLADWLDDEDGLHAHLAALKALNTDRPDAQALLIDHSDELSDRQINDAIKRIRTAETMTEELGSLGFSLALWFDRTKAYDRAWEVASEINRKVASMRGAEQTKERRETELRIQNRRLDQACRLFEETRDSINQAGLSRYVYLIGAPRTGSSLLQSVLSAPGDVVSLGERAALYAYLRDATDRGMSASGFTELATQLGTAERAGLERQGKLARVLVDKTPHHAYVAGLLERVNPGSRFVNVFRDAGDVALSMYLRPFAKFFAEATDLEAIADLMEFRLKVHERWTSLGLDILPFSYERFTRAPDENGRKLYDFSGLDWSEAYLNPASRPDAVPTFSSRQVRKPITETKQPKWKAYEGFAPEAFARLNTITTAQNALTDVKDS